MNQDDDPFQKPRHILWLWVGVLATPLAWGAQMAISYAMVPALCQGRHGTAAVQAISVVAIVIGLAGLALTWRHWRQGGGGWPSETETPADRTRFIAVIGLLLGALLLATMVLQGLPSLWVSPCE